ncbi:hypothetical protein FXN63_11195 [Pigmentiphaga aceris]|uniref:Uncharacterized protein n=1 Tax=Pigmentiphaga aceris TaxID=1940612 RepID=A0A5C0AXP5_9BURK|nr:hypothetical protein [Pigmentiphaga aceris]QEI06334.1 hypothetical protein FXN63_11195 [Pigmentiphaga aceris]
MPLTDDALWRTLPDLPDVLDKIANGQYTLHGGVVRHAAGTEQGGQIVGHLLFPGDAQQTQQSIEKLQTVIEEGLGSLQGGLDQVQQSMGVLQGLQVANLALSGLNLAVSTAGFIVVCKKLDALSAKIQAQSQGIIETLKMVGEAHDRSLLGDEAQFRSLIMTAQQFCEHVDVAQLKSLVLPFTKEYQFTKLVLQKHARSAASNVDRFDDISLLQNRLINMGLMLAHVQLRAGTPVYAQAALRGLAEDIVDLNKTRIEALTTDHAFASRVTQDQYRNVRGFLRSGKEVVPALSYQADLIGVDVSHPGTLAKAAESKEILLFAA